MSDLEALQTRVIAKLERYAAFIAQRWPGRVDAELETYARGIARAKRAVWMRDEEFLRETERDHDRHVDALCRQLGAARARADFRVVTND